MLEREFCEGLRHTKKTPHTVQCIYVCAHYYGDFLLRNSTVEVIVRDSRDRAKVRVRDRKKRQRLRKRQMKRQRKKKRTRLRKRLRKIEQCENGKGPERCGKREQG